MIEFNNMTLLSFLCCLALTCSLLDSSEASSDCNRTCGAATVPYPFGFTSGCPITLNCSGIGGGGNRILLSKFPVRNITSQSLLLDVPPSCNRPVSDAAGLFGPHYAPVWTTALFLRNCTASAVSGCTIATSFIAPRLNSGSCGNANDSLRCEGFLEVENVTTSGCGSLFTAGREAPDGADGNLTAVTWGVAELGWWLDGGCRCSANATCVPVPPPAAGNSGFRCRCDEGFAGDGYAGGDGCKRVISRCTASNYMSGSCGGKTRVGVLVGGIVGGACVLLGLALLCLVARRRLAASEAQHSAKWLLSEASFTVPLYSYKDIERATHKFSEKTHRLGTGAYGTVYVGKLTNDELVAIKRIRHRDADSVDQIMNEIKLISSVRHPNLVRLLGCCVERGEQILVYELMPNGTLSQHLHRERGQGLPWATRLAIAHETANAVAHLHSLYPPIYHRDIKSSNILLDRDFGPKLADFGLSRAGMTELSHISTAPQGTPGYLDPQYHQDFHLSDKSDVYSFGVVLVEMITALKVVDFGRAQSEVNLASLAADRIGQGRIEEIVDPFVLAEGDPWVMGSVRKVAELAFRCLAFQKDVRPTMAEVAEELEQIRRGRSVLLSDESLEMASHALDSLQVKPLVKVAKRLDSPVSVQEMWISERSSPSTNESLGRAHHRPESIV